MTATASLPQMGTIPLPANVEELNAGKKFQFSRQRIRDLSAPVVLSQHAGVFGSRFMSDQVSCSSTRSQQTVDLPPCSDQHVGSYDCMGMVSLHSVMQTNVPKPFKAKGKAPSHLNMPGGSWGQGHKYIAEDLQNTHYRAMVKEAEEESEEGMHDKKILKTNLWEESSGNTNSHLLLSPLTGQKALYHTLCVDTRHFISPLSYHGFSQSTSSVREEERSLSRKDKLKKAVKEYGATVIIFHVGISLISLGGCYMAVSRYVN